VWQRHPLGMAIVIFTIKLSHPQALLEAATRHTPFEYADEPRISQDLELYFFDDCGILDIIIGK